MQVRKKKAAQRLNLKPKNLHEKFLFPKQYSFAANLLKNNYKNNQKR